MAEGRAAAVDMGGGDLQGEFVVRAEDGRLVLRTKTPLTAAGVTLSASGRPLASGTSAVGVRAGRLRAAGMAVSAGPVHGAQRRIRIVSLEARLGGSPAPDGGQGGGIVERLVAGPPVAAVRGSLPRLTGGDASGSFEASLDATREVRVKLALSNLAAAAGSSAVLPAVTSEIRADFEADGRVSGIPIHMDYGTRVADLALTGSLSPDSKGRFLDATLEGTRFIPRTCR